MYDNKIIQFRSIQLDIARTPFVYWQHRIKMIKAMGYNTVTVQLMWSNYYNNDNMLDFTQQFADIKYFLDILQEEGMYAILDPGFYNENVNYGGMPSLVMKTDPAIPIRTYQNVMYNQFLFKYIEGLSLQIHKYIINQNDKQPNNLVIILLENEYDKWQQIEMKYIQKIKKCFQKSGIEAFFALSFGLVEKINMELVEIVDVIQLNQGLNYSDIEKLKQQFRDNQTIMINLLLKDTLDYGQPIKNNREIEPYIMQYLNYNVSYNIYQCIAATNFRNENGVSYKNQDHRIINSIQTTNQYSYGLIDEIGQPSTFYYSYRDMIKQMQNISLPEIPKSISTISTKLIKFQKISTLYDYSTSDAVESDTLLSFQHFNMKAGYITYQAQIPSGSDGTLIINGARDSITIYINQKFIQTLDNCNDSCDIQIKNVSEPGDLQIIVESIGHSAQYQYINFDRKGILGGAVYNNNPINKWTIKTMNFNQQNIRTDVQRQKDKSLLSTPGGVYEANFSLLVSGDTYFVFHGFTNGYIFINNKQLGYFNQVEPTQCMYIPSVYIKEGINTILVFDNNRNDNVKIQVFGCQQCNKCLIPTTYENDCSKKWFQPNVLIVVTIVTVILIIISIFVIYLTHKYKLLYKIEKQKLGQLEQVRYDWQDPSSAMF